MMNRILLISSLLMAACGSSDTGGGGPDANNTQKDAPGTQPITIKVSGKVTELTAQGETPVDNATVELFLKSNPNSIAASATTNATGAWEISYETTDGKIDGFVKGKATDLLDTYLYPPKPINENLTDVPVFMARKSTVGALAGLCGTTQSDAKGFIGVVVSSAMNLSEARNTPVQGATVSSTPAAELYCYKTGIAPATSTGAQGIGFMINVPIGVVNVSATKAGGPSFQAHDVETRAGAITMTLITP